MRGGKGLVQVVVHHIEAEVAGTDDAGERVHVCAVPVNQPAAISRQLHHLLDVFLEQAQRVGVGDH